MDDAYAPIDGCSYCMGTGSVLSCPTHGPQARYEWWCPSEQRRVSCPGPCPDGRSHVPVEVEDLPDLTMVDLAPLRALMDRLLANTGAYAGDYPLAAAGRVTGLLLRQGWRPPRHPRPVDQDTPFFLRSIPDEVVRARIGEIIEAAVEQRRRGISDRLNAALVAIGR